ncbi:MAG: tetratricopeptide repeat protein [Flavobacteriales bacterium]|nr:tetratricopeptide repeat protein [Flavobacteriales bacterium]MCB9448310.1 tetratricopeptide repeat protein [Flavobacteriales bacterium]
MATQTEENVLDLPETLTKTEAYIEENKNSLSIVVGAIVVIIAAYLYYAKVYIPGQEAEAESKMFTAEYYFKQDSLMLAINGNGMEPGFKQIADDYGMTASGNLAEYYQGISYLRLGQFQEAIDHLGNFDSDDAMLGPIAIGAIGDAYMELNQTDKALSYYQDAADKDDNHFTAPIYLKKAATAQEMLGKYADAAKTYKRIQKEFPDSREAQGIEKYIARAEGLVK